MCAISVYLVSVAKFAPLSIPAPKGLKDNSPGREPGVSRKAARSPEGETEKGCGHRSTAPAGALSMQHPIRGLAPPAIILRPLRGFAARERTEFRNRNRLSRHTDMALDLDAGGRVDCQKSRVHVARNGLWSDERRACKSACPAGQSTSKSTTRSASMQGWWLSITPVYGGLPRDAHHPDSRDRVTSCQRTRRRICSCSSAVAFFSCASTCS